MKKILVTGAAGQIGSELTVELREIYGKDVVVAADIRADAAHETLRRGPFEFLEITDGENLARVVKKHDIGMIYHLAGVLSAAGEQSPQHAWHVNVNGLYNVLEIARELRQVRVFWPSSIAVFGKEAPHVLTPQETALIPTTMYGVSKVAGELLCNYYFNRFGVDVRSVRYPGVIGGQTPPGGGTTDYAIEIFHEAFKNRPYTCFLREDTVLPMIYMPDCIKAIIMLMEAEASQIKCRTSYNLTAMSFSAGELVAEIKKYFPEFKCEYKPDFRQMIADSWPMSIDDSIARKEWGWKPIYDLAAMTKDMMEKFEAGMWLW